MAGITDLPFRKICKNLGAGLVVSEMTAANPDTWNSKKTKNRILDFERFNKTKYESKSGCVLGQIVVFDDPKSTLRGLIGIIVDIGEDINDRSRTRSDKICTVKFFTDCSKHFRVIDTNVVIANPIFKPSTKLFTN